MPKMETNRDNFIDQHLLQQLRCLGTTDKDELVKQFKMLVGNNVGNNSARFLLDMNDWNLQAAVGSYYDFEMPVKLPSMALVRDELDTDNLRLKPCARVAKFFTIVNNGDDPWPAGCYLQFCGGDNMSECQRVHVPSLDPNQTARIVIHLIAPSVPAMYRSEWRMVTGSGSYFGDIMWIIMTVTEDDPSGLIQQLSISNLNSPTVSSTTDLLEDLNHFGNPQ